MYPSPNLPPLLTLCISLLCIPALGDGATWGDRGQEVAIPGVESPNYVAPSSGDSNNHAQPSSGQRSHKGRASIFTWRNINTHHSSPKPSVDTVVVSTDNSDVTKYRPSDSFDERPDEQKGESNTKNHRKRHRSRHRHGLQSSFNHGNREDTKRTHIFQSVNERVKENLELEAIDVEPLPSEESLFAEYYKIKPDTETHYREPEPEDYDRMDPANHLPVWSRPQHGVPKLPVPEKNRPEDPNNRAEIQTTPPEGEPSTKENEEDEVVPKSSHHYRDPASAVPNGPHQGEHAPKCMYNFIINELDSNKCPMVMQQMKGYYRDAIPAPAPAPRADIPNRKVEAMRRQLDGLETKVYQQVAENRMLRSSLKTQISTARGAQQTIEAQQKNISRLMDITRHLQITHHKQRQYYRSLESKLQNVMLDIIEVNSVLSKRDPPSHSMSSHKSFPVEAPSTTQGCGLSVNATRFKDCEDVYQGGYGESGIYYITPIYSYCPIPVYCDMDTPPGGWLLLQRRMDGSTNFTQNWRRYRQGFGDVNREFWLGNDNIFLLSNQMHYELRIDLWDFYGSRVYAEYLHFRIDGERDRFRLHVSNHSGTAPDGLGNHNGVYFSTPDIDNDLWQDYHCAREWASGWWFNNCWFVILNGPYYNTTDVKYRGISWNDWKAEQLKRVEIKIRPSGF